MADRMLIMCRDIPVLSADMDIGDFEVLNEALLPFQLKKKIQKNLPEMNSYTHYDIIQQLRISRNNNEALERWLSHRSLSLGRKNAKWLYHLIGVDQGDSEAKLKISMKCQAVSILDHYWIKLENDKLTWKQTNVKLNPLNDVIAQVALHGAALKLQGSFITPELTTGGAYAKAWRRHSDKSLWLYKKGADGNTEARIEEMVSRLLDKCNVEHVPYILLEDQGEKVCACPCATNTKRSILSGTDYYSYCNIHGLDMNKELERLDAESLYKMWIVDYLISNRDRHGENWGMYYDPVSMEILGMHPLWDHNNSFDTGWMQNPDVPYQFGNMTVKQAAHYAVKRVDFHFTQEILRSDFIIERQYRSFMSRANELGIQVIPDSYEQHVKRLLQRVLMEINSSVSVEEAYSYLPRQEISDEDIRKCISNIIPPQE